MWRGPAGPGGTGLRSREKECLNDISGFSDVAAGFPVYARGVIPVPGTKAAVAPLNGPVRCGGVTVRSGDIVVADEEGVVVTPADRRDEVLLDAEKKLAKEAAATLADREAAHRDRIDTILRGQSFTG